MTQASGAAKRAGMDKHDIKEIIEAGWDRKAELSPKTSGDIPKAVNAAIMLLDSGRARVAEPDGQGGWVVNEWLKKAVLMSFRISRNLVTGDFTGGYDKVRLKTADWGEREYANAGFRMVPGAIVRRGAYVGPDCVLMPSFVNIGAHVGAGAMIDTWATVGSCAQIGKGVHLSGGAGIGGVLEPLQAAPTIIEDNVFIGARSEVAEGVIVREGAVLSMGVFLSASTRIVDRESGEILRGEVPAYSVVVPGTLPSDKGGPSLACAVIVKRVDERTRAKTGVNALLRT